MDGSGELVGEDLVDHPVPLDPALALEGPGYDVDTKMCLSFRTVAGMARMKVGFVGDVQADGGQFVDQFAFYGGFDGHGANDSCEAGFLNGARRLA